MHDQRTDAVSGSGKPCAVLEAAGATVAAMPPILHRYKVPAWRIPQPGDVALCGYVKTIPARFPEPAINRPGYQVCAICLAIDGQPW